MLSFIEWYRVTYNHEWHEDYATLYGYATQVTEQYEDYCNKNNVTPIWNW